jgi:hypothetical protein
MLGFKRFDNAVVTISGIELAEKIKKGQFKTGKLGGCNAKMTDLWNSPPDLTRTRSFSEAVRSLRSKYRDTHRTRKACAAAYR